MLQPPRPDPWTDHETARWQRIAAHAFETGTPLDFLHRLAREKSWSLAFARGAIDEYRRFAFLCAGATTQMTPSEEVDEVWHLHLTYSRDYWDIWCATVLQTRLHHDPTPGGPAAQARYRAQYAATIARYEAYFGLPPEAWWPATAARFRRTPRFRGIDTDRAFIVPHSWLTRLWRRRR
jgi:hypothetical protein